MAANRTAANGTVKNASMTQLSVNIHQMKTKFPTPMWITLRMSMPEPFFCRYLAIRKVAAINAYTRRSAIMSRSCIRYPLLKYSNGKVYFMINVDHLKHDFSPFIAAQPS